MSCYDTCDTACEALPIQPQCLDLTLSRGTDNSLEVVITDGDGRAIVITNDTVKFTVKDEVDGTVVFEHTNMPGGHSSPGLGQTIFEISAADTATASATADTFWVFEVRRITPALDEFVHISGQFIVRPTI